MKRYFPILFIFSSGFLFGQPWSNSTPTSLNGNYRYLTNSITVKDLGILDGVSLAVTSLKIKVSGGTSIFGIPVATTIDLYLVAPDGHAINIMSNDVIRQNAEFVFTNTATNKIQYDPFDSNEPIANPYIPYVDLNALNVGQSANGPWQLYAKNNGVTSRIESWEITFGNTGRLEKGSLNQGCDSPTSLENTSATGKITTGDNRLNGIVLNNSYTPPHTRVGLVDVGVPNSTEPMRNSIWYSFVPECEDDIIEITGSGEGFIYAGIVHGDCNNLVSDLRVSKFQLGPQIAAFQKYQANQKYYLIMDSDEADHYRYSIKWLRGTCLQPNSITTIKPSKTSYCVNDTVHIKYSTTGTFTGYSFTAQLSDANGNFATPHILSPSIVSGTIVTTLPSTLPAGPGYKVRVVSDNPVATTVTESAAFQINTFPSAPTEPDGYTTVCAGQTNVTYSTSTAPPGIHYRWKFPNGTLVTSNLQDSSTVLVNYGNTGGSIILQAVNSCGASASSSKQVTVNALVNPEVTIEGDTALCLGNSAFFKAIVKNGGPSPLFTWWVNDTEKQATGLDSTFKLLSFQDHDTVKVLLSSSAPCAPPTPIISKPRIITLTTTQVPSVKIEGNTQLCQGDLSNLRAKATNAGNGASYVWKINRNIVNVQGPVFSYSGLMNHDTLTVDLKTDNACANPKLVPSLPVVVTVDERSKPTVSINVVKQGICQGDTFLFEALPSSGGTRPKFKWAVNRLSTADTLSQFQSNKLKNKDTIKVLMTTNAYCVTDSIVNGSLPVSLTDTVQAKISISGETLICPVQVSQFQAQLTPAQPNALFDWLVNDTLQSDHGAILSSFFKDKDTIKVSLANPDVCIRPRRPQSSSLVLSGKTPIAPTTPIYGPVRACTGDTLSYFANVSEGGTKPIFQWYINETAQVNDTLPHFTTHKLKNGDSIHVQVKSNEDCAVPNWTKSTVYTIIMKETTFPSVIIQNDSIYCKGQDITLTALPQNQGSSASFTWSIDGIPYPKDASTIHLGNNLSAGNHKVSLTMSNLGECARPSSIPAISSFLLKDSVTTNASIVGDTSLCIGSATTFTLANPLSHTNIVYNWQLNGTTAGTNQPFYDYSYAQNKDSISLLVTTDELCTSSNRLRSNTLFIHAIESIEPKITVMGSQSEVCVNKELRFLASIENPGDNEQFQWFAGGELIPGAYSRDLVYLVQTPTQITLKYTTDLACGPVLIPANAPAFQVKSTPTLTTLLGPNDFCRQNKDVLFSTDIIDNVKYIWSIPNGASIKGERDKILLSLSENSGLDTLKVKAQNDCGSGNELYMALFPKNCSKLFIPNAIAANDANGNNIWQIKGLENYPNAQIQVFNRWGEKVFQSQGYSVPWDGSIKDKPLPAGTYYYVIQGTGDKPISGDLTILH